MSKIYLASPYSHKFTDVRQKRYEEVVKFWVKLIGDSHVVYCPIGSHHPAAEMYQLPTDHLFWKDTNKAFLNWAEILMVYCLEGWGDSEGIRWEIGYASEKQKIITFEDPIQPGRIV